MCRVGILNDTIPEEELEVYGVDWEEMQDSRLLEAVGGLDSFGQKDPGSWVE